MSRFGPEEKNEEGGKGMGRRGEERKRQIGSAAQGEKENKKGKDEGIKEKEKRVLTPRN